MIWLEISRLDLLQSEECGRACFAPPMQDFYQEMESFFVNRILLHAACSAALTVIFAPALLTAQTTAPTAQTATSAKAATEATQAQKDQWHREYEDRLQTDFPWLAKFKEADLKLGTPAEGENRVVFMGDSITEGWHFDQSFPGKPYVNRGISGQTTPQMLGRFRQDVIALKPKVVVIMGGTNDIAGNTGPMTLEQTEDNLASMAELAAAHQIRVVLCSVTPAFDYPWQPGLLPAPKILTLNAWIKHYAAENGFVYVDYHSAMKDSRDGTPSNLSHDGVHPLPAGYALMAPLVEAGIAKALEK